MDVAARERSQSSATAWWSTRPEASGGSPRDSVAAAARVAGSTSSPWAAKASRPSQSYSGGAGGEASVARASAVVENNS